MNMNFNISGIFFYTTDPMNGHFKNIVFDWYRLVSSFIFYTNCNYPEAAIIGDVLFEEILIVRSNARLFHEVTSSIIYMGAANVTIKNSNFDEFYFFPNANSITVALYSNVKCIPNDGEIQIYNYQNISLSLDNAPSENERGIILAIVFTTEKYRKSISYTSDSKFANYEDQFYPVYYISGTLADDTYLINNFFSNLTNGRWDFMIIIGPENQIILQNNTFENGSNLEGDVIRLAAFNYLQARNTVFRSYNLSEANDLSYFAIQTFPWASVFFDTITVENWRTLQFSIISSTRALDVVSITNGLFTNIVHTEDTPLFNFHLLKSFQFINHNFSNVHEVNGGIIEGVKIQLIDLNSTMSLTISQLSLDNCHIELVKINAVFNNPPSAKQLTISNLNYTNSHFPVDGKLVESGSIQFNGDLLIMFDNLLFKNISFPVKGKILSVKHQLKADVILSNSVFSQMNNAGIEIESTNAKNSVLNTRIKFIKSSFDSINGFRRSFISISEGGRLRIDNCTFTNIVSFQSGSIIDAGFQKSETVIENSIFRNNSAAEGGLFFIESESFIICRNWTIVNNFALIGGIVYTTSGGTFEFYESQIHDNYAYANAFGVMNEHLPRNILDNEFINKKCSKLWFIDESFINNVYAPLIENVIEDLDLFLLILSSLVIENNTIISNQEYLINSYISSIVIKDSEVHSIWNERRVIELSISNLTLSNMNITNIVAQNGASFIFALMENNVKVQNVLVKDSQVELLEIRSSEITIDTLKFINVASERSLMRITNWREVKIDEISVQNWSSGSMNLFEINESKVEHINGVNVSDVQNTVFNIYYSDVSSIGFLTISNWSKAMHLDRTSVGIIKNSVFTMNGGSDTNYGGAIELFDSEVTLSTSQFIGNKATSGGAVAFRCTSLRFWSLNLDSSSFKSNTASVQGGAIYYNYKRPTFSNVMYQNNSAEYGRDIASYPVKIQVENSESDELVLSDVGSGVKLDTPLNLKLVDFDNQTIVLDNSTQIFIQAINFSQAAVKGFNAEILNQGVASFDDILFIAPPGSKNIKFSVICKAIDAEKIDRIFGSQLGSSKIFAGFRYCKRGEFQTASKECHECSTGTYSFDWNSSQCYNWMEDAMCLGKTEISVDEGYWRRNSNSTKIVKWLNKDAWNGGYFNRQDNPTEWAKGYEGNLCSEWSITDDSKYQHVGENKCQKCPNPILNTFRVVGVWIVVFAFMMALIVINIRKTKDSKISIMMRIMTNYLQILSTSMSFSVSYPKTLTDLFVPVSRIGATSDTFLSFDCFIEDYVIKGPFPSKAFFKLFLSSLLPLILFFFVSLIWVGLFVIKRKWVPDLKRNIAISVISILFLIHPKLTENSLEIYRWVEIDQNVTKVRIDTNMDCYSVDHINWTVILGIPSIVVWVVGCPVFAFVLLYRNISKLESNKVKQYFLILFQGLRHRTFYWEFANSVKKMLILVSFFMPVSLRILFCVVVLVASIRIQKHLRPYKEEANNQLEMSALFAGVVTLLSGLSLEERDQIGYLNLWILIFVLAVNLIFLSTWGYTAFKIFYKQFKQRKVRFTSKNSSWQMHQKSQLLR
jgi:predicted outer membrane repeat protein